MCARARARAFSCMCVCARSSFGGSCDFSGQVSMCILIFVLQPGFMSGDLHNEVQLYQTVYCNTNWMKTSQLCDASKFMDLYILL